MLVLGAVSSSLYGRDCNDRLYTSKFFRTLRCTNLLSPLEVLVVQCNLPIQLDEYLGLSSSSGILHVVKWKNKLFVCFDRCGKNLIVIKSIEIVIKGAKSIFEEKSCGRVSTSMSYNSWLIFHLFSENWTLPPSRESWRPIFPKHTQAL